MHKSYARLCFSVGNKVESMGSKVITALDHTWSTFRVSLRCNLKQIHFFDIIIAFVVATVRKQVGEVVRLNRLAYRNGRNSIQMLAHHLSWAQWLDALQTVAAQKVGY